MASEVGEGTRRSEGEKTLSDTVNIIMPYLAPGQAQKHVTVNEALRRLDAVVQLSVMSATTTAEPGSPGDGQVWIVPAGKSGMHWAGFANWSLGYYRDGAWEQIIPREGWVAYVKDTDEILVRTSSAWTGLSAAIHVSATDRVLGRSSSGAGAAEEIACTAAGRALIDDANAAAQRATLGLGTAAVQNTGTSGSTVPLLSNSNTFGAPQAIAHGANHETLILNQTTPATYNLDLVWQDNGAGRWITTVRTASSDDFWLFNIGRGSVDLGIAASSGALTVPNGIVAGATRPAADNAHAFGSGSFRWSEVFAATGTINTSDAREKTKLRPLEEAEKRAVRRVLDRIGVFRWLSSVTTKGEAARLHVGVTAQAVAEAFAVEGLDAARYALWCADPVEEVYEAEPARVEPAREEVRDAAGNVLCAATPEYRLPPVLATRPAIDPLTGQQRFRLGVRHDQLFAMALATLINQP
jgi:hypothetical protein